MPYDIRQLLRSAAFGTCVLVAAGCADRSITPPELVAADASVTFTRHDDGDLRSAGVFAMTNDPTGNAIAAFYRSRDGVLTPAGSFPTSGMGSGGGPDPLRSQGSLILAARENGRRGGHGRHELLLAVNAGSNDISVLAIGKDEVTLVDMVSSGGVRPTSLTIHRDLVYVLNAGSGTITGFRLGKQGRLTPIAESTRPITGGSAADPSEVSFTPDGRLLVVTGKTFNAIDTYVLRDDRPLGPRQNRSAGMTPFGFAFDNERHLVVSEASGGAPGQAAASSYDVSRNGTVTVISPSVRDFQTAACWVVITNSGRYAFVSNTNSSDVSSYRISSRGALTLQEAIAGTTDPGSTPIDMDLTPDSRLLFVLNGTIGTINGFRVTADGRLARVSSVAGLPPYTQGIVAN